MFFNLFDSHTHSRNSPDGKDSVEALAQSALEKNMSGIAITDHFDVDRLVDEGYRERVPASIQAALAEKERCRGRLDVAVGVEIGQPWADYGLAEQTLERYPFDFVIGSVHRMRDWPDLHTMDCAWMGQSTLDDLMHTYFDDVDRLVEWDRYDVLGHLSFPLRGAKRNCNVDIDFARYRDRTDRIFRRVIDAGKGIEINTSSLRSPLEDTMPSMRALCRYRELGGTIVTIGSDAHGAAFVGAGLQQGMGMLHRAGFTHFTFYRARRPVLLRLV